MGRNRLAQLSFPVRLAVLVGVAALSLTAVAPVAWSLAGGDGVAAATAGCGACTLAAALALTLGQLISANEAPLAHLGGGLFVRMTLPLAYALVLMKTSPALVAAGGLYYLVVFYLVTLAVETALTLPIAAVPASTALPSTGAAKHG